MALLRALCAFGESEKLSVANGSTQINEQRRCASSCAHLQLVRAKQHLDLRYNIF